MNKQQVLKQLEKSWIALKQSYAGLSDSELLEPGVAGDWSIKDILAHVATWEAEALKHLPEILNGIVPQRYSVAYGGIDAFNAQMAERNRRLSLDDTRRLLNETHERLIKYIERAPEEQLMRETRFRRRLRLDTYGHVQKHARAIAAWRKTHEAS